MLFKRYRNIAMEGIWAASGQAVYSLGLLAGIKAITSIVNPEVYGALSLYVALLNLCSGIFARPLIQAGLRFYHETGKRGGLLCLRKELNRLLRRSSIFVSGLLVVGSYIFVEVTSAASYWLPVALAGLLTADIWRSYESSLLNAARNQKRFAVWLACEGWMRPAGAVIFLYVWGAHPEAVLSGYAAGAFAGIAIFNRPEVPKRPVADQAITVFENKKLRQDMLTYARPLFGFALVSWIASAGDRYLLGWMRGMREVGIYAAAYGLIMRPFMLVETVLELTIRPLYFEAVASGQKDKEKLIIKVWLYFSSLVCLVGITLAVVFKIRMAAIFLGPGFEQSSGLLPYIAAGGGLIVLSHVLEKPFYAYMQTKPVFVIQCLAAIFGVVTTFVSINFWGLQGVAIAVPIYCGFQFVLTFFGIKLLLKKRK